MAIELGVVGEIHLAHAAGAEQADDFMSAEMRSGGQTQSEHNRMRKDDAGSRCNVV